MSASRVWTSIICSALLAGLGGATHAATPTGKSGQRVVVYPAPDESVASLEQAGLANIKKRGSYWLADATDTRWQSAKRKPGTRIESADHFTKIELSEVSFDVTQGEPNIPAHLQEVVGTGTGLRLVQFKGPVTPEWLEQLKAIAGVRLIHPIPNNAYLIAVRDMAEDGVLRLMGENGPLQWVGGYHPYYKIPAVLRTATGLVGIKVAVLDDADEAATVAAIKRFANGPVEARRSGLGQVIVNLRVNAADVAAVAQIASVLWIQPALPVTTRDEVQALVLTGNFAPGPGDPGYLTFLDDRGFLADPSLYPVLDICDTGVDVPSPYCTPVDQFSTWHPAFYFGSAAVSPDFSCCPPLGSRKVYYSGINSDTDGHGTRVASIAIGFDTQPDEVINCITQGFVSNCVTTITPQQICTTNGFNYSPCTGNFPPECCTNLVAYPFGCPEISCVDVIITNISCTSSCVVNDASIDNNNPPPPWYLSRRDLNGFQLGLGVSPYGLFGVSSMDSAKDNPEGVAAGIYISYARISNNSWTEVLNIGGNDGAYNDLCQSYDKLTRDTLPTGVTNSPGQPPKNQPMLFVFAGGNDNGANPIGGYGDVLITPPATAKNVITVGATVLGHSLLGSANPNQISPVSSFGPTRDGRFKPDLVAPGQGVAGAISQAAYTHTDCGGCDPNNPVPFACEENFATQPAISKLYNTTERTFPAFTSWPFPNANGPQGVTSYAAPAVSGGAQLLYWYIQSSFNLLPPSPALLKTYLLNSARYLSIINPLTGAQDQLPSIAQGMGMMDLARMFDGIPRLVRDESTPRAIDTPLYPTNSVAQQTYLTAPGQTYEVDGQIADPGQEFRVTIAWTDAPGNPSVLKQLVNNLDLEVTVNGQIYAGNDFATRYSAAKVTPRYDSLNNVESVFLPAGTTGTWKVVVRAVEIAGDGVINVGTGTDQDFALVVYNGANPSDSDNTATNNACQTAKTIGGFPFSWTNQLSKAVYRNTHPSPATARGGSDEFFIIPRPSPGTTFTVDTFGSNFDTVLSVWRGSCGSLVEQVSNNNSSNTFQSAVSFTANGLDDYFIVAEPHNDGPGGTLVLKVSASFSPVILSPSSLAFPDQVSGGTTSALQTVTLQNGLSVPLNVQTVALAGSNSTDFVILSETCSGSFIQTNGSCSINIAFAPATPGLKTAQLVITDSATGSPRTVPLSGTGLDPAPLVCLSAPNLFFDSSLIGVTSAVPQTVSIQNCGTAPLLISSNTISGLASADFFIVANSCGTPPVSIGPGSNCLLTIGFLPTTNGNRNAVLSFFDTATDSPQSVFLLGKGCSTVTLQPLTLANPVAGSAYSEAISASGGVSPYSFSITAGGLPAGLSLDATGLISGTATNLGVFTFTVTATDATGCTGTRQYSLTVGCGTLTVQPASLTNAVQGVSYTNQFTVLGGVGTVNFTVSAGALPPGLSLALNGTLAGTPSAAGSYVFTVSASDANGCGGSQAYTMTVTPTAPIISVTPANLNFLDQLVATTSAVQQVTINNAGSAPLTIVGVSLTGGNAGSFIVTGNTCLGAPIAPGASCVIGIAARPQQSGLLDTTLRILSNAGSGTNDVVVHGSGVAPVMQLSTTALDFGTNAVNVTSPSQTVVVQNTGNSVLSISSITIGGVNPDDFAIVANSCQGVLILPGQVCQIEMTFKTTTTLPRAGLLTIVSNATNTPQVVTLSGVGLSCPLITVLPASLTNGVTGTAYNQTVTAANGVAPYTFAVATGELPPGLTLSAAGEVTGTPTAAGTYNFSVQATDDIGCSASRAYTVTITCPVVGVGPETLPDGPVGVVYSQSLTASNGVAPYAFTVTSGALPVGLTLSSGGTISGTPTTVGTFAFTVQALDANGCAATKAYSLTVVCPFIGLVPNTLTNLSIGISFSRTIVATNGTAPYVFSVLTGSLPPGLNLNAAGLLQGTPTTAGTFNFTIRALDTNNCAGLQAYSVSVSCPNITLTPATLPALVTGQVFSQPITATNGAPPYAFSIAAGALPPGLNLTPTGTLTGTPTVVGNYAFTVQALDANDCAGTRAYSLSITCPFTFLTPANLPAGQAGNSYFEQISMVGGSGFVLFEVTSGAVPPGLTLDDFGYLYGTPTTLGTYTFEVTGTDEAGCSASRSYTIPITCPTLVYFAPGSPLPVATRGVAYFQTIQALSLVEPINYTITSGTLPPGLTFALNGELTGTPTLSGTYTFTVRAVDINGCNGSKVYSVTVSCDPITVTPATLPNPILGVAYSQAISALTPTGTLTFARTSGTLPPGLTLSSGGLLSGTPTLLGTFTFKVSAINEGGCTGDRFYTLTVGCPTLAVAPATLPIGEVGVAYSQTLTPSGGAAPYVISQTAGSLPAGMTLSSAGVLSGTPLSGSTVFTVTVTDANGCQKAITYTLVLANNCPTISVTPVSLANGFAGAAYNQALSASGGVAPHSFSMFSGALPSGLTLSAAGVISGAPTTTGTVSFTVAALDSSGCAGFQTYSLATVCATITVNPAQVLTGTVGQAYSQTITATGGVAPQTFAVTGGALPSGLALETTGELSGTPTAAGTFAFTVTATDSTGCTGSRLYSLVVIPAANLALTMTGNPNPVVVTSNLTYSLTITNLGPSSATGVTVVDELPAGVDFVAASSGCGESNGVVTCDLGTVASGASVFINIVVAPTTSGTLSNQATVSSAVLDLNVTNNLASVTTTVSPIVELTAQRQIVSQGAGNAVLNVTRQGNPNSLVTVQYATSDGTAVAGTDYTATAGTVSFAPGVMQGSIAIPLLTSSTPGKKTVKLNLHSPTGGATLGARSSATIEIVTGTTAQPVVFTDSDGDQVTVTLTGPGSLEVALVGDGDGPIDQIAVLNTTSKSKLNVKVKRAGGGNGQIDIGSIVGAGSLKDLNAKAGNLTGAGINFGGALGKVTLNTVANSLIAVGFTPNSAENPMGGGTFAAASISSVKVAGLVNSTIAAAQIGKVQLAQVTTPNAGQAFGVLAQSSIGGVTVKTPSFKWNSAGSSDQAVDDFHVKLQSGTLVKQ
ncbi:MAG: hypothetical protein PCFJNLEI_03219 [Verrucomicrobiae bacterium]|nr:hypothetical protein [Verrucomicrobiae bacterium]